MTPAIRRSILPVATSLLLAGFCFLMLTQRAAGQPFASMGRGEAEVAAQPTPPVAGIGTNLYLPFLASFHVELTDTWIEDSESTPQEAFLPGDPLTYITTGWVNRTTPSTTTMTVEQDGPCGPGVIFSDTVVLPPAGWVFVLPANAQNCVGLYSTVTSMKFGDITLSDSNLHVVNPPTEVVAVQGAGFDKCAVTTVEKMQTWWDASPYSVANLYIGGIAFACPGQSLDAVWVQRVAQQGWTFIPTWVGPQAPCTNYIYRMSANPAAAYQEGKTEAAAAAVEVRKLGFFNESVIYYDVEAYFGASQECRDTVDSFMRGWAEELHELGFQAGGYGAPCSSYMVDWSDNSPPPDDVWLAHWITNYYSPTVTVWDTNCVTNNMWSEHQRIKQYAGGHSETWGGASMNIDSNVLDGEVNSLPVATLRPSGVIQPVRLVRQGPEIRAIGLTGQGAGWVLAGDRILVTDDGGGHWRDASPEKIIPVGITFLDAETGWAAGFTRDNKGILVARTADGGASWDSAPLPISSEDSAQVESASLHALDEATMWVSLRLHSGTSFSRGILLASGDGGRTWERRQAPLGEPVEFRDANNGWMAGGPAGDLLYRTRDGGRTWSLQELVFPEGAQAQIGLPHFDGDRAGWLPVVLRDVSGQRTLVYRTSDGGDEWMLDESTPSGSTQAESLADKPDAAKILLQAGVDPSRIGSVKLPDGTTSAEFFDSFYGWVVLQEGSCTGDKVLPEGSSMAGSAPFECTQRWQLFESDDGGLTWRELSLSGF